MPSFLNPSCFNKCTLIDFLNVHLHYFCNFCNSSHPYFHKLLAITKPFSLSQVVSILQVWLIYSLRTHDQASLHNTWWFAAYKFETFLFCQAAFQFLPNPKLLMYDNYNAGMKHKHKVAICLHIIYGKVSLQFLQSQGFQEFPKHWYCPSSQVQLLLMMSLT